MNPIKNCEGVNSRDTDNIGEQFKKKQKKLNNTDPIITWGKDEHIGDQVKNKLKEWATGIPSKTGEGWT